MTRWMAVPICSYCDEAMSPDDEGDFVCRICSNSIENEDE